MGQFRLRKKYRTKELVPSTDDSSESGLENSGDPKNLMRFRPKSFVMQPRDQTSTEFARPIGRFKAATIVKKRDEKPTLPEVGSILGKFKFTKQIGKGSSCLVFTALHQA